jgi:hypothetical protein
VHEKCEILSTFKVLGFVTRSVIMGQVIQSHVLVQSRRAYRTYVYSQGIRGEYRQLMRQRARVDVNLVLKSRLMHTDHTTIRSRW